MQTLVRAREMAEMDRRTIHDLGVPGRVLMEVAGRGVADIAHDHMPSDAAIAVLCGSGNNGGDGFVAARALASKGHRVQVYLFGHPRKAPADAAAALDTLRCDGCVSIATIDDDTALTACALELRQADVIIDALFGTGLKRSVGGRYAEAIAIINETRALVVAVDIPSGLHADTGAVLGCAVQADITITFACAKRGHILHPGKSLSGALHVLDIGIPTRLADDMGVPCTHITAEDGPTLLPSRDVSAHKGDFGRAVILAGTPQSPGAAMLAVRGALRAGAGWVVWATEPTTHAMAPQPPPEMMLRLRQAGPPEQWTQDALVNSHAVGIGPGWGLNDDRQAILRVALEQGHIPVCADADALTLLGQHPELWTHLAAPLVITPHPREMHRLTGVDIPTILANRADVAQAFAETHQITVLLKGSPTVVAGPDGCLALVDAGSPALATGGTGDVLTGVITAFLARGLTPFEAARLGALLHACAGEKAALTCGETGTLASDVADALGGVLADWRR